VLQRLLGYLGGHVVVEDLDLARSRGPRIPGVLRPVVAPLTGCGDHSGDQHDKRHRNPGADQRRGEAAQRLRDENQVRTPAIADRLDNRVGVLGKPRRIVLTGEIHRDRLVSAGAQLGREEVPVEGAVAGAVDERIGRHPR
jgi:hypothetical protein